MRTLTLCLGNTSLFGGVFVGDRLANTFRELRRETLLPRQLTHRAHGNIDAVALCSVVPSETAALVEAVERAFPVTPHVLTAKAQHGLKIDYRNPRQLGTDRLAAAIGAQKLLPRRNVVIVDCGTATTITALQGDGVLRGGAILPGLALWPEMLSARTAQLPQVSLARPHAALGRSPREAIASGIFFGHVGAIRETVAHVSDEAFGGAKAFVVGTGGYASRFAQEGVFSKIVPSLVLHGLHVFALSQHDGATT